MAGRQVSDFPALTALTCGEWCGGRAFARPGDRAEMAETLSWPDFGVTNLMASAYN